MDHGDSSARVPVPVQVARALLAVVATSHLVVPIVMGAAQGALRNQLAAQHPEFGPAEIARSADIAVVSAGVFHGALLAVCVLLLWKLASSRRWARRLATISQLLSVGFSVVSWTSSPMFHAVILVVGAAQLTLVALLWLPPTARRFFTVPDSRAPRTPASA